MNLLLREIKLFSKENGWVYIVFAFCLWFIYITEKGNILEISIIVWLHFLGDIFMMMMWDFYAAKEYIKWNIYQLFWFFTIWSIAVYWALAFWEWQYILVEILFAYAAIKSYLIIKNNNIFKYFNSYFYFVLFLIIFYFYMQYNPSFYSILQLFWLSITAFSLTLQNDKQKYFAFLLWTFIATIAAFIALYENFLAWNIYGTSLSFMLFPLTVFVFYLKNLKTYLPASE